MEPAFMRTMWLPVWRRKTHPSRSNAQRASRPLTTGSSGNGDVHLDRADGERQFLLGPNLQARDDRLANVREGLLIRVLSASPSHRFSAPQRSGVPSARHVVLSRDALSCNRLEVRRIEGYLDNRTGTARRTRTTKEDLVGRRQ